MSTSLPMLYTVTICFGRKSYESRLRDYCRQIVCKGPVNVIADRPEDQDANSSSAIVDGLTDFWYRLLTTQNLKATLSRVQPNIAI